MLVYKGKYTYCKVFTDEVEKTAVNQIQQFLDHPAFEGCKTRFMPDIHAGAGSVIGTTAELGSKIIPNVIGVDIGCGVLSVRLNTRSINPVTLDAFIKENIPHGFNNNQRQLLISGDFTERVTKVCEELNLNTDKVLKSVGSLGGGNHFIEVGKDQDGNLWLTVHSGSRNFGLQVAKYHQNVALTSMEAKKTEAKENLINLTPPEERMLALKRFDESYPKIPKGMEYLEGEEAKKYIEHMKVAQELAETNRKMMINKISNFLGWSYDLEVESVHNYINFVDGIIRKGAVSAQAREPVVIPWNMRDGLIIGVGKGNPDWNYSAPHGAGRDYSRTRAKAELSLETFKEQMVGIYSSCVSSSTLDECPMAYKDHKTVLNQLKDTVEVLYTVKPIYNFKA